MALAVANCAEVQKPWALNLVGLKAEAGNMPLRGLDLLAVEEDLDRLGWGSSAASSTATWSGIPQPRWAGAGWAVGQSRGRRRSSVQRPPPEAPTASDEGLDLVLTVTASLLLVSVLS